MGQDVSGIQKDIKDLETDVKSLKTTTKSDKYIKSASMTNGKLQLTYQDGTKLGDIDLGFDLGTYVKTSELASYVKTTDLESKVKSSIAANAVSAASVAADLSSNNNFAKTVGGSIIANQLTPLTTEIISEESLKNSIVDKLKKDADFKITSKGDTGTISANSGLKVTGRVSISDDGNRHAEVEGWSGLNIRNSNGMWTHFNGKADQSGKTNWIRGTTQVDGDLHVDGKLIVGDWIIERGNDQSNAGQLLIYKSGHNGTGANTPHFKLSEDGNIWMTRYKANWIADQYTAKRN